MTKLIFNPLLAAALFALAFSSAAFAQLKVATGGPTGTYSAMFKELSRMCTSVQLTEVNSTGSNKNVDLLVGNQINGAFVQTDVLFFRARSEDLKNVKTLVALHPEEIHVIAPSVSRLKEGGTLGFGAKPPVFNTVADLAGRRVGAFGGSVTTAMVIRLQSEINFTVVQFKDVKELMTAINAGTVEAGLMVGGSPMADVAALTPNYKLLPFPEVVQTKLKGVYRPSRLSYSNLNAAGVQTIATDALFVTREYKTPKMIEQLAQFRACAKQAIPELQETTGSHPKWQAVDVANEGKWPYYVLPNVAAK